MRDPTELRYLAFLCAVGSWKEILFLLVYLPMLSAFLTTVTTDNTYVQHGTV